ncbi:30S ribosomal protein S15 [Bienertia sinuspersici]
MDTLTLSADNTTETVENMVFGCANDSEDKHGVPGVVGLSNESSSLIGQLGVSQSLTFYSTMESILVERHTLDPEPHSQAPVPIHPSYQPQMDSTT